MNEPTDLNEHRNLLTGSAWEALVALVVAEADYEEAVEAERQAA